MTIIRPGASLWAIRESIDSNEYESFLMVMPGKILSDLYGKYGDRLQYEERLGKQNGSMSAPEVNMLMPKLRSQKLKKRNFWPNFLPPRCSPKPI